ncbi:MAG: helix-turn-helix transcriptional regulator [Cellulosilyticaceae bacterium]
MSKNLLALIRGNTPQNEMAKRFDVSQQTWSSWEKGRTAPDLSTMLDMEKEYGIPMEVIFFEESNYKMKLKETKTA